MEEAELSHAQVWDDTELVDSWNEALEEYKKYHSLALKGEKVKVAPETLANGNNPATGQHLDQLEQPPSSNAEFDEEAIAAGAQAPSKGATLPAVPQAMMGTVQSEDMKNLMLSWYYAGYYTGLYEGKQQGYISAKQEG